MIFLTINNRKNFLLKEVLELNPHSKKYISWWKEQTRRCIDGFWSIDDAQVNIDITEEEPAFPDNSMNWRYIPPACYFYVNYGTILMNRKGATSEAKIMSRPNLDDVEWEYHYNLLEARGFSGFEFDDTYSCNRFLISDEYTDEYLKSRCKNEEDKYIDYLYSNFFKKNGDRKEYIPVREYVRKLFPKNMGRPIYANVPKNMMILATRDGGKSYLTAGAIAHEITIDGVRMYTKESIINPPKAEVVVGAAISDKSKDILNKTKIIMDNFPGYWKKGTKNEIPCPFFKHMSGSLNPTKEWYHEYQKKDGGGWKGQGSGSSIKHRVFSTENPEAAAGGRPGTIVCEEVGLTGNIISVHGGNDAAQNDGGEKFGTSIYIGTAGNVEKILESEVLFSDPEGFDFIEFENIWEEEAIGKISWFIPAPYMARKFKDINGNTLVAEASKHFNDRRARRKKAASRKAYDMEIMNYPLKPSEMFINATDNLFPVSDLKNHYSHLLSKKGALDISYKGHFALSANGSANWVNEKKTPIREFPLKKSDANNINGCIEIFEMPVKNADGIVPSNVYLAGYDPIDDDDDTDVSRSLQSFWITNSLTGRLVLEYTGRTSLVADFYEQCRRSLLAYNARVNYENNKKGFYGHMFNKAGLHMLAETPEILMQKDMQKSRGVGNKGFGTNTQPAIIKYGEELLLKWLTEQAYDREPGVMNLHTIKSPALLKELIAYNPKGNFDRISALFMLMILKEDKLRITTNVKTKVKRASDDPFFSKFRGTKMRR